MLPKQAAVKVNHASSCDLLEPVQSQRERIREAEREGERNGGTCRGDSQSYLSRRRLCSLTAFKNNFLNFRSSPLKTLSLMIIFFYIMIIYIYVLCNTNFNCACRSARDKPSISAKYYANFGQPKFEKVQMFHLFPRYILDI